MKAFAALCFGFVLAHGSLGLAATPDATSAPLPAADDVRPPAETEAPAPPVEPTAEASKSPAAPTTPLADDASEPRAPAEEDYGHALQFGLRAGLVGGYRVIFRYDKSPFCREKDPAKGDKDEQKLCGHGAPLATELALSFALLDFVEPYAWARIGLASESETDTDPLLAFGVGARIYTMSDSKFKIFVEPALGMEVEKGAGSEAWRFDTGASADYKKDLLFHLAVGPQYDFARVVGVYLDAGLTTGVLRYIHSELELSGGVQLRLP